MLNADAIELIINHAKSEIDSINSHQFHVSPKGATAIKYPQRESVKLFSLGQLLNWLKATLTEGDKLLLDVVGHDKVRVINDMPGDNLEVDVHAESDFSKVYESFPFEDELTQEDFTINVMTKFAQDDNTTELLKLVSSVKSGKIVESSDDGYSQEANIKAGVHLTQQAKVKNLWNLKTFKSFPEVDQPVIPYVLRLHQRGEETPKFALYDCDGGAWKVAMTKTIRDYCIQWLKSENLAERVIVL